MSEITIGKLSARAGVKIPTIRYYETIGLMDEPPRTRGGQRRYQAHHLERLRFIRHGRDLGFSLDDLRALQTLSNTPDQSCEAADIIAREQLIEVERRLKGLRALRTELKRMVQNCAHGTVGECRVIETLSDHSLCAHAHGKTE
jgi:DNA-binding transcriptional MerR regulator